MARRRSNLPQRSRRKVPARHPVQKPFRGPFAYGLVALAWCAVLGLIVLVTLSACSVTVYPEKPPIAAPPPETPPLVDEYGSFSKQGQKWVQDLAQAYLRNCVTLKVLRGEDPLECQQGLR